MSAIKFILKSIVFIYALLLVFAWVLSDSLIFLPPRPDYEASNDFLSISSPDTDSANSHKIIARYRVNPDANYTMLYSHGNAVDLGGLDNLQQKFIDHGYSVFMYDYSGYGQSEGTPSEQQVYNDAQAAYDYLVHQAGIKPESIILYGHSLGSAIATDLASHNTAKALVLESPLSTAFTVKTHYSILPFDKFDSLGKIASIHMPVFIVHSIDDNIIPVWHAEALFSRARNPKKLLKLNHAGHTRITHQGDSFWQPLQVFISSL